jgi:hypothetical protein
VPYIIVAPPGPRFSTADAAAVRESAPVATN